MSSSIRIASAVLLAASSVALAQAPAPSAAGPSSAASAVALGSALTYRSTFEGYRGFAEQPVVSWREANDLVGRIGGWQAYAREGQGGMTMKPPSPTKPASGAGGHSGHHSP
jgi:hypothetical protein